MKTLNRQEAQGRFFLLSIPDLIRDPEGRYGSFRASDASANQSKGVVCYEWPFMGYSFRDSYPPGNLKSSS
jgi:hypothetical protein